MSKRVKKYGNKKIKIWNKLKLLELKDHEIPKKIAPNIFNNNKIEFEILLNWIKEKKLTTKQIYDYMLRSFFD